MTSLSFVWRLQWQITLRITACDFQHLHMIYAGVKVVKVWHVKITEILKQQLQKVCIKGGEKRLACTCMYNS